MSKDGHNKYFVDLVITLKRCEYIKFGSIFNILIRLTIHHYQVIFYSISLNKHNSIRFAFKPECVKVNFIRFSSSILLAQHYLKVLLLNWSCLKMIVITVAEICRDGACTWIVLNVASLLHDCYPYFLNN